MSLVPATQEDPYRKEGPIVTVIGSDRGMAFEEAQPSPVMVHASRIWRTISFVVKASIVIALVGAYPAMMVASHQIDATPVDLSADQPWAAPEAGVLITLIAREVQGPGMTSDKPSWHPAKRLVAQPAWQAGINDALADFTQLAATMTEAPEGLDPDLAAASRLLRPVAGEALTPRLTAAAEALAGYDGRVERGIAERVDTYGEVSQMLRLFVGWASESGQEIAQLVGANEAWPAAEADVRAFYRARARAHVAVNLLRATTEGQSQIAINASLRAQIREVEMLWGRVAAQAPLMVSNQDGEGLLLPNHLAAMAWHLEQAEAASLGLAEMLLGAEADLTLAGTDTLTLAASP